MSGRVSTYSLTSVTWTIVDMQRATTLAIVRKVCIVSGESMTVRKAVNARLDGGLEV
jgi:hypothetical protein